eukprot:605457-Pelagomonas_calceolata.AAC.1
MAVFNSACTGCVGRGQGGGRCGESRGRASAGFGGAGVAAAAAAAAAVSHLLNPLLPFHPQPPHHPPLLALHLLASSAWLFSRPLLPGAVVAAAAVEERAALQLRRWALCGSLLPPGQTIGALTSGSRPAAGLLRSLWRGNGSSSLVSTPWSIWVPGQAQKSSLCELAFEFTALSQLSIPASAVTRGMDTGTQAFSEGSNTGFSQVRSCRQCSTWAAQSRAHGP